MRRPVVALAVAAFVASLNGCVNVAVEGSASQIARDKEPGAVVEIMAPKYKLVIGAKQDVVLKGASDKPAVPIVWSGPPTNNTGSLWTAGSGESSTFETKDETDGYSWVIALDPDVENDGSSVEFDFTIEIQRADKNPPYDTQPPSAGSSLWRTLDSDVDAIKGQSSASLSFEGNTTITKNSWVRFIVTTRISDSTQCSVDDPCVNVAAGSLEIHSGIDQ